MGAVDVDARIALSGNETAKLSSRRCLHDGPRTGRYRRPTWPAQTGRLLPVARRQRDARLAQLERRSTRYSPEIVIYADEVDIHLNPKIGPDWMLRGIQRQVITPGKNEKRYLAGALDASTRQLTWVEWKRNEATLFCQFYGASWLSTAVLVASTLSSTTTSSTRARSLAAASSNLNGKIVLHFFPPYCPITIVSSVYGSICTPMLHATIAAQR